MENDRLFLFYKRANPNGFFKFKQKNPEFRCYKIRDDSCFTEGGYNTNFAAAKEPTELLYLHQVNPIVFSILS
jgi:hypothetical protein